MSYINPIDDYERTVQPNTALRYDYPETLTQHLPDCPYDCDDLGQLETWDGGVVECGYCNEVQL